MKKIIAALILSFSMLGLVSLASPAYAAKRVSSYYRKSSGTYVQSYYRTSKNSTRIDNYSTKGNYNPYTGKYGTKKYLY